MPEIWKPANKFHGVIDISHHNGEIKWSQVPPDIALVFIKATQGTGFRDPRFAANREGAIDVGKMTAPYHFLEDAPVEDQLDNLVSVTQIRLGSPVMVDWEKPRPPASLMEEFLDALEGVIKRPALVYRGMLEPSTPAINARPWHLPRYRNEWPGPKCLFWQHTDKAQIPGITGYVDQNWFAGTLDELKEWWKTGKLPADAAAPPIDLPGEPLVPVDVVRFMAAAGALNAALRAPDFARKVQTFLNGTGLGFRLKVDGVFGLRSKAALDAYLETK